ncbi:hypothetical protein Gotri_004011 [Gossypium trilobum]|uniref:Shikimate O-hydroxycinnamoyltransferase n=1 Tax=Gossypium trilobum TaxID=34281 RepID=A0A7J9F3D2_9ROSI|nr:hypothetical protein [Gossypium trilobum]
MEITIKESTIVRPAEGTPKRSLWNSNLDIVMAKYHLPTIYYYKPNGSSDFFDIGRLKEALSKILVPFYPIAGRLGYDENGRLEIRCNAEGVLFVEAETTSVMEHLIGDFTDYSQVFRLVPKVDYSGGISSYPLLVLQVIFGLTPHGACLLPLHHSSIELFFVLGTHQRLSSTVLKMTLLRY